MSSLDHIDVDGISFAKASYLAKQFKYTQDYIGQLCRAKKVNARLVGRTWYVDPASLEAHKDGRYAELRSGTIRAPVKSNQSKEERPKIEPRQDKRHLKLEKNGNQGIGAKNFYDRLDTIPPMYTNDASELIPLVRKQDTTKEEVSVNLPLKQAGAVEIPIEGSEEHLTQFRSEKLPSVVLEGDLDIEEVPENMQPIEDEKHDNTQKINVISDNEDLDNKKEFEEEMALKSNKVKAKKPKHIKVELTEKLDSENNAKNQAKSNPSSVAANSLDTKTRSSELSKDEKASKNNTSGSFVTQDFLSRVNSVDTEDQVSPSMSPNSLKVTKIVSETPSTISLFKYAPAAILLALIAGGVVLSLDSVLSAGDGFLTTAFEFNLASLQGIFN